MLLFDLNHSLNIVFLAPLPEKGILSGTILSHNNKLGLKSKKFKLFITLEEYNLPKELEDALIFAQ